MAVKVEAPIKVEREVLARPSQTTDTAVMVSPDQFGFNSQTAATNIFQTRPEETGLSPQEVRDAALEEFNGMVKTLRDHGITILVLPSPSRKDVVTPDAVFPNNWFSHHQNHQGGLLIWYPMLAPNRRAERQVGALRNLLTTAGIGTPGTLNLTSEEDSGRFLEGTGSLVLDRVHKVAFAMESPRTSKDALDDWCRRMGFEPVFFHAYDKNTVPFYHTNIVITVGERFAVLCPESIKDEGERDMLLRKFKELDKELIPITLEQLYAFCGNILQMQSKSGERKIILSTNAMGKLTSDQIARLEQHGELVPVNIPTIEKIGGGSARCMLAEIFRSRIKNAA
ncbi:MAG: arginine deiminase-related protein [bacterium]|nr:arginine deiminase-related protein [bacterium]